MNDALLSFAIRIQSIAQAGLQYGRDPYDLERYAQLRQIAAEMLSLKTELSTEKIYGLFAMRPDTRPQKSTPEPPFSRRGKSCWSMKTTAPGPCPEAGAM